MTTTCPKCGGAMQRGFTTAIGLIGGGSIERGPAKIVFVVSGTPTSINPVKAFQQGLADEPANRAYHVVGARCSQCGFLELYSDGEPIE